MIKKNILFFFDKNNHILNNAKEAKLFMIKNVIKSFPEALSLLSQDVLEIIFSYYQSNFRLTHIAAYRTSSLEIDKDLKEVFAHRLHYDCHPVDTVKLFITLSDITKKDGPLTFFDQNFSKFLLKMGYRERNNYGKAHNLIENSSEAIFLIGEVGTAVLCNTPRCLHRAGIPESGRVRDLLVFSFESDNEPFDPFSSQTKKSVSDTIEQEYSRYK